MKAMIQVLLFGVMIAVPSVSAQCSSPYLVEQKFPVWGPEETRWRICWQVHPQNGLIIAAAYFRTKPEAPWVKVLGDARVSEIFVKYHDGTPYDDMQGLEDLADVSSQDCPAGTQLKSDPDLPTNICLEIRDRLAWKEGPAVRRGQEVVIWGALIAGNYNYVIEWTFRDDGMFNGRVGATASNLSEKATMVHMHDVIWRLDVDLDGAVNDSVALGTHAEDGEMANDMMTPISIASGMEWNQMQFNFLEITDAALTNGRKPPDKTSYMLIPLLFGTSRHSEGFTKNDLWVTPNDPTQMYARDLPSYLTGGSVSNKDIVCWIKGSLHHMPRDEDGEPIMPSGWQGETQVMWTGFILMPNNLFDRTPFYP